MGLCNSWQSQKLSVEFTVLPAYACGMQWCPAGLSHRRPTEIRWEPGTWRATEFDSPATTATNCRGRLCACACQLASGPERRRNAWFPVWINLKCRSRLLPRQIHACLCVLSLNRLNWSLGWITSITFCFALFFLIKLTFKFFFLRFLLHIDPPKTL